VLLETKATGTTLSPSRMGYLVPGVKDSAFLKEFESYQRLIVVIYKLVECGEYHKTITIKSWWKRLKTQWMGMRARRWYGGRLQRPIEWRRLQWSCASIDESKLHAKSCNDVSSDAPFQTQLPTSESKNSIVRYVLYSTHSLVNMMLYSILLFIGWTLREREKNRKEMEQFLSGKLRVP